MFVEAVRLLVTLALLVVGFNMGEAMPGWFPTAEFDQGVTEIWGAMLGAGCGYVIGGVIGRALDRSIAKAPQAVSRASGAEAVCRCIRRHHRDHRRQRSGSADRRAASGQRRMASRRVDSFWSSPPSVPGSLPHALMICFQ